MAISYRRLIRSPAPRVARRKTATANHSAPRTELSHPLARLQRIGGNRIAARVLANSLSGDRLHNAPRDIESYVSTSGSGNKGQPLPSGARANFEPRFGRDFGDVRVHDDDRAHRAAARIHARAFTAGASIHFSAGAFEPGTRNGDRLLAHELTHVVQQSGTSESSPGVSATRPDSLARQPVDPEKCGPTTDDPFCLNPERNDPCTPFVDPVEAQAQHDTLSVEVPLAASVATGCKEVGPVWDEYFAATSAPFAFSSPTSCVVKGAQTDPEATKTHTAAVNTLMKKIVDNLPITLLRVTPNPFPLGGPIATVRMPLKDAIGTRDEKILHPKIVYNNTFNAAANIAGAVGESDVFGPDDREMSGTVIIEVDSIDPLSGEMTGRVRWRPHVHVVDTVDFCPGNLGNQFQQTLTIPMSKLEAMGMTGDVPITIDYNLELQERSFNATPFIGPLPPAPVPPPAPTPSPGPVDRFPRSGPAKTTGSRLRIRRGPSLRAEILGLLHERGTPIVVKTQVRGDSVDGNDVWDKIDRGFVSDRFVAFD